MDVKQFNLFQQVMQFAQDEARRDACEEKGFEMESWIRIVDTSRMRFDFEKYQTEDMEYPVFYHTVKVSEAAACGTAACLAGSAVLLNGADDRLIVEGAGGMYSAAVITEDGRRMSVSDRAQELFGLEFEEAYRLFHMVSESFDEILEQARLTARRYGYALEVV